MPSASVLSLAARHHADAKAAAAHGADALLRHELVAARNWFARARRMVPNDPAIAFALAGVLLQLRETGAVDLLTDALTRADTAELWLSAAAAHLQNANLPAARHALGHMLSGHVLAMDRATITAVAGHTLAGTDQVGWCGVMRSPEHEGLCWIASAGDVVAMVDGVGVTSALLPPTGKTLTVTHLGAHLLGSPIDLSMLRRTEGLVEDGGEGLRGWALHPADAAEDPWLIVTSIPTGASLRVRATNQDVAAGHPMARPRGFSVSPAALAHLPPPLAVSGLDGSSLTGSPVSPGGIRRAALQSAEDVSTRYPAEGAGKPSPSNADRLTCAALAALRGPPAQAPACPERPVAIVIPAYRDASRTLLCLESVFASTAAETAVIVVDDATPEPSLAVGLDALAAAGRITLIRHRQNQGFPASANAGLRAAFALTPAHDALLLNSDTLLPTGAGPSWLDRMRRSVHAAPDIGTATPFSNDGGIMSYPARDSENPMPDQRALQRRDDLMRRANAGIVVDIPTGVGFCLYIRRECVADTGVFRTDLFAQGYGEENDLCIRARHLGWRHVAVPGVFVGHAGGASFGTARPPLAQRNLAVLEQIHPGYLALVDAYQATSPAQDALAPARRRADMLRWAVGRKRSAVSPGAVILVSHASGGGVERVLAQRITAITGQGLRAIVLRPVPDPRNDGDTMPFLCSVSDGSMPEGFPNLVFDLRHDMPALVRLLRPDRASVFEVHHRLGHDAGVMSLAPALRLEVDYRLHDYASFCPRVTLFGAVQAYCGEPVDIAVCNACVAEAGARNGESIGVAALRARSAAEFARARRIVVPSADMASRLRRHFPAVRAEVVAHEQDMPPAPRLSGVPAYAMPRRIAVIGALGVEKGYNVLLDCARDAAERKLALEFVLVGHSVDDARLFDTGRVFVTGRYGEAESEALVRAQNASLAFLPSIVPETWGFTLSLAWRAGLRATVFDLGAMASRVRETGWGVALPLGLPARMINQVLLQTRGTNS